MAMRQSQTEMKAIEAELRSIRVDKTSGRSVTLLEPHRRSEPEPPISPTIVRPSPAPSVGKAPAATKTSAKSRSVECFPVPDRNVSVNRVETRTVAIDPFQQQVRPSVSSRADQTPVVTTADRELVRQILEDKARQINSLSHQQEAIIRELMLLSDRFEQELQRSEIEIESEIDPICEYVSAEVPYVDQEQDGTLLLTTRSIDWPETDWPETHWPETGWAGVQGSAASVRRKPRRSLLATLTHQVWQLTWRLTWQLTAGTFGLLGAVGSLVTAPVRWLLLKESAPKESTPKESAASPRRKTYRGSGRRAVATEAPFSLKSAVALVIGSAALRICLDWVVVTYPLLWFPSVLVMLAPALFAVYRSTVTPDVGFAWGYRLFAIMIGLLLGGRL